MAEAIRLINTACPSPEYLTLKGYEALQTLANGQATKIIIPSNLQDVTGLIATLSEVAKTPTPTLTNSLPKEQTAENESTTENTALTTKIENLKNRISKKV